MNFEEIMIEVAKFIAALTVLFNILYGLSKLTKSEKDDNFFRKAINILTKVTGFFALNRGK